MSGRVRRLGPLGLSAILVTVAVAGVTAWAVGEDGGSDSATELAQDSAPPVRPSTPERGAEQGEAPGGDDRPTGRRDQAEDRSDTAAIPNRAAEHADGEPKPARRHQARRAVERLLGIGSGDRDRSESPPDAAAAPLGIFEDGNRSPSDPPAEAEGLLGGSHPDD